MNNPIRYTLLDDKSAYHDPVTHLEWAIEDIDDKELDDSETASAMEPLKGSEWRIPTRAELLTIVDDTIYSPATILPGMKSAWYRTASPCAGTPGGVWFVDFYYGDSGWLRRYDAGRVRLVRGPVPPEKRTMSLLDCEPDDDRLKRCPFCGGEAEYGVVEGDQNTSNYGAHFISCLNRMCEASSALIFPTGGDPRPLLLERWNKRPNVAIKRLP